MSDTRWDADGDDATHVRPGGAHGAHRGGDEGVESTLHGSGPGDLNADDLNAGGSNMERLSAMFDGAPDDELSDEPLGDEQLDDAPVHVGRRRPRWGRRARATDDRDPADLELDADLYDQTATQTQLAASGDAELIQEEAAVAVTAPARPASHEGEYRDQHGAHRSRPAVQAPSEQSIARASALMAVGSIVSRVLGLVRQSLLTSVVLAAAAANAFAVANTLPNYVYMLLSAGLLNAVLIPQITKAMARDDGGQVFVNRLVTWSLTLVIGVAVIATVMTPWLVNLMSNFTGATYNLTVVLAYICVPQIAFYGIYAVLGQVLNARNQFAAFMWAPVLTNIVQIAGLVWFLVQWGAQPDPRTWTHAMVWVLAGSSTLGIAVQALFLIVPLARGGFHFRPVFRGLRGSGLGSASRMAGWTFAALLVSMGGGIVVSNVLTTITNRAGNEHIVGYAGQQYAFLVFMIPHAFITTSVLTALYPRMSRAVHDRDDDGMRMLVRQGLVMPATAVIPASIGLAVLAVPVVKVMFSLKPHDSLMVGEALAIMALGTLPFGITTLQQRYCFAREDGWLNLWMQFIVTGGQVLFLLIALVAPARHAVLWAAAGQTIGNTIAAAVWLLVARRQLGGLGLSSVVRLWVRLLVASLVGGVLAGFVAWGLSHMFTHRMGQLLVTMVAGLIFVAAFWIVAQLLRITEVDDFVDPILRRIPGMGRRTASA